MPAATRGVLFMNLKSGGGKAERFHLVDECKRRGIEPVVLGPGLDWLQTVKDVAASGVDVLGMAGGDGSQAMVGTVAAEVGLPMVVVPAGTRNHLALDLGLDRDDVVGALDALRGGRGADDGPGRRQRPRVREQRVARAVRGDRSLPRVPRREGRHDPRDPAAGPGTGHRAVRPPLHRARRRGAPGRPHDPDLQQPLRHTRGREPAPDGHPHARRRRAGARPGGATPAAFLAALASGHPERFEGYTSWATPTFEVTSDAPIDMGLDGETEVMDPPLRFSIRPSPVRVRLPKHAIGYSPAARSLAWADALAPAVERGHGPPGSIGS